MRVNSIFTSIQGEGARCGSLNTFIRFSGCNLACALSSHGFDCDTEFSSGQEMSEEEILLKVEEVSKKCQSVILTGGEPTLQITSKLIQSLKNNKYFVAIETNGTRPLVEPVDWICVSPKTAEHTLLISHADELRYVRHASQSAPCPRLTAKRKYVSPAWTSDGPQEGAVENCIRIVQENPSWEISLPMHKLLKVE